MTGAESICKKDKKTIHTKVTSGEWSYEDVLMLNDSAYNEEAVTDAKAWAQSAISARDALISDIKETDQVRILRKVAFSEDPSLYPRVINEVVGDEISIVLLDVETTGFSHVEDTLIELGLVKLKYSPSKRIITSIELVRSEYQDPGRPIPPEITELTGISNSDTDGKAIDVAEVTGWLENEETYIIAHNAKFDRPFFSSLVGGERYKWGCSASQIDWRSYDGFRIESAKLEYILLKMGYFYEGHRASIDCLAMVQMFVTLPEALEDLLKRIDEDTVLIEAKYAPFDMKDALKAHGYRWNPDKKVWGIEVPESTLNETLDELGTLGSYDSSKASITRISARERFM